MKFQLSHPLLRRWYRQYNDKYFGSNLTNDVEILFAPSPGCCAETWVDEAEERIILINPMYAISSKLTRWHLLHEMAHVEVYPYHGHGPKFQSVMLRLAQAGAFRNIW